RQLRAATEGLSRSGARRHGPAGALPRPDVPLAKGFPKGPRRDALEGPELPVEVGKVPVADLVRDEGYGLVRVDQHRARLADPQPGHILGQGHVGVAPEQAMERADADQGKIREVLHPRRLAVVRVDMA